jgi:SET domain-containing protein
MPARPFRVGRSLTGLGLFATREIKKRARIIEYRGPRLSEQAAERAETRGNRYLFEVSKHVTIDGTTRSNVARYANHSCNPNAEAIVFRGRVFIKSLRRIKPGEEITYSYGGDYLRNVIGKSNCKCGRCRRRRAKQQREARLRKKTRERRAAQQRAATRRTKTTKATSRRTSRP